MKYLLVCRSITYARRMRDLLEANAIKSRIVRTPVGVASEGCGYSVEINYEDRDAALNALSRAALPPKKTIRRNDDGTYAEVSP